MATATQWLQRPAARRHNGYGDQQHGDWSSAKPLTNSNAYCDADVSRLECWLSLRLWHEADETAANQLVDSHAGLNAILARQIHFVVGYCQTLAQVPHPRVLRHAFTACRPDSTFQPPPI